MATPKRFVGVPRAGLRLSLIGVLVLIATGAIIGTWFVSAAAQHEVASTPVAGRLVQEVPTVPTIPPPTEVPTIPPPTVPPPTVPPTLPPTDTPTLPPSATPTPTLTPTPTCVVCPTDPPNPTYTPWPSYTPEPTYTVGPTLTSTGTSQPTNTPTPTPTIRRCITDTPKPTSTPTPTPTPSWTPTRTFTPTRTPTQTSTVTPAPTDTRAPSPTLAGTPCTPYPYPTYSPYPSSSPYPTSTPYPTYTSTQTSPPTATPTPTLTPTSTPTVDLSILGIEITQAIQCFHIPEKADCLNNSVPLVEKKPAIARLYVDIGGAAGPVAGVTARLYLFRANTLVATLKPYNGSISAVKQPLKEPDQPGRKQANGSLNFLLPGVELHDSLDLCAEVNPDHTVPESNYYNNRYPGSGCMSISFDKRKALRVGYVPITYRPPGSAGRSPTSRITSADMWMRKIYPLAYVQGLVYMQWPGFTWSKNLALRANRSALIAKLNAWDSWWHAWRYGSVDQVFGWLPEIAAVSTVGLSDPPFLGKAGRVAWGQDWAREHMTMAHEIGHNLNRRHPDTPDACGAADSGTDWPKAQYGNTSAIQEYGFDVWQKLVLNRQTTYDLMSYCASRWISPFTYGRLYNTLAPTVAGELAVSAQPTEYLLTSGTVYTNGTALLDPFYRVSTSQVADGLPPGIAYCLELRAEGQQVLHERCFDLAFVDPETMEPIDVDFFSLQIPYPAGVRHVALTHGDMVLAERAVSQHAPQVTVTSPAGGEYWSGTQTVTWAADDEDGDTLTYVVLYSADDGQSWLPIATDLTEASFAFDTTFVGGGDTSRIRVLASDGVNTGLADSAAFGVSRKPPEVFIDAPEEGTGFTVGEPVLFLGHGYDLEDGPLPDAALSWRSDHDGFLGNGEWIEADQLSPGTHRITLSAQDSDGNVAEASVNIRVGAETIYLPLCLRDFTFGAKHIYYLPLCLRDLP